MRMMAGLRWSQKAGREKVVGGKCRVTVTRRSFFPTPTGIASERFVRFPTFRPAVELNET